MQFRVVIVVPPGWPHGPVFAEIAETLVLGLQAIGHKASAAVNQFLPNALNIVLGGGNIFAADIPRLPPRTVVYNLEQIDDTTFQTWPDLLPLLRQFEVWDFSEPGTIYYVTLKGPGGPAGSLSFDATGGQLAVAGDKRVLCWALDPPSEQPTACGTTARVPITVVAWHPNRALIAAGTAQGAVSITEPQGQDALHLRDEGGGAVTVLAWSADGGRLAIGTAGGDLGVLPLPDALFRPRSQEASR